MHKKFDFVIFFILSFMILFVGCRENYDSELVDETEESTNNVEDNVENETMETEIPDVTNIDEFELFEFFTGINRINLQTRLVEKYKENGLPIINIFTENEEEPSCEYIDSPTGWGKTIQNATKVPGRMTIIWGGAV